MVALNLFGSRSAVPKRHDRYLIYRLIGQKVSFDNPAPRSRLPVVGVVEDVCRNIFDNEVEVILQGGRVFKFPEPTAMMEGKGGVVVFIYGDVIRREQTDKAMFREMRRSRTGENVNDVLRRTALEDTRELRFVLA